MKGEVCQHAGKPGSKVVITGITRSYLSSSKAKALSTGNYTMVVNDGEISCFGAPEECLSASQGGIVIKLKNGHVTPGLTAVSINLGLTEIVSEASTGDGGLPKGDVLDPETVSYAKYGVHLEGRAFRRAKIGGITRAITAPLIDIWGDQTAFLNGVSVGIKTSEKQTILNGGIFRDDVALHITIGQDSKCKSTTR